MKLTRFSLFVLFALAVVANESAAQTKTVPDVLKRLARSSLSCDDPSFSSEKIGPARRGYVATCADTEIAIFEKVQTDFRKIFKSDMPMRAQWSFGHKSSKGYYNFGWVVLTTSGGACEEIYRWNGISYVKILDKCSN